MKNILKTILLLILCCTLVFAYACGEEEKPSADNNDATDTPDIPDDPGNTDETNKPDEPEQPGNTDEPQQPSHTHTWVKGKATEPSCKEEGEQTYECSCGETKTEPIAKLSS
ncbi:MAG: hypothetical protein IKM67_03455, partial [Clostridia bacterium]|nr:hypothetical protein [Clostridia bacterium]